MQETYRAEPQVTDIGGGEEKNSNDIRKHQEKKERGGGSQSTVTDLFLNVKSLPKETLTPEDESLLSPVS